MATSVRQLREEAIENSTKKTSLHNPDTSDFEYQFKGEKGIFKAQETREFDYFLAQHIRKHLAEHLMYKRDDYQGKDLDILLNAIYREIDV